MAKIEYTISWEEYGDYPEFKKIGYWMPQTLNFTASNPRHGRAFMKANLPTGKVRNFSTNVVYR